MIDSDLESMTVNELQQEVMKLRMGIRNHRDLKGNNRCHLDDKTLYLLLPEKAIVDTSLPPKNRFLKNCELFHEQRQGCKYALPEFNINVKYKDIKDFLGYKVGSDGSLWGCKKSGFGVNVFGYWQRLDYDSTSSNGRIIVGLYKDGMRHSAQLHRVILETFNGPPPSNKMEVCHNNGNFLDNRIENLRWDTHIANKQDEVKHNTRNRGEARPNSKLTEEKVREIKNLLAAGEKVVVISKNYGVSKRAIQLIRDGINWAWVT
jgi:hypothetical protein